MFICECGKEFITNRSFGCHKGKCQTLKEKIVKIDPVNIIKLYTEGYSLDHISKEYKLSRVILEKILKENNIQIRSLQESKVTNITLEKTKNTIREIYGVDNLSQSEEIKKRKEETTFLHYGVKNPYQSEEIKKKVFELNKEKYGDGNYRNREQITKTWQKNYGVNYGFQAEHIKEQIRQTNIIKYGVDHRLKNSEEVEKQKQSNLLKYGFEHIFQCAIFKEKGKQTNIKKYGVEYRLQNPVEMMKHNQYYLDHYGMYFWQFGMSQMNHSRITKGHQRIIDFLSMNNIIFEVEFQIGRFFCDIFIPNKMIIEFNGDFWHANPKIYNENDILNFPGKEMVAKDIWKNEEIRIAFLKNETNLPVVIIWESELSDIRLQVLLEEINGKNN